MQYICKPMLLSPQLWRQNNYGYQIDRPTRHTHLPIDITTYPTYLLTETHTCTYQHTYVNTYLQSYLPTDTPTYRHTYLPTYLPTELPKTNPLHHMSKAIYPILVNHSLLCIGLPKSEPSVSLSPFFRKCSNPCTFSVFISCLLCCFVRTRPRSGFPFFSSSCEMGQTVAFQKHTLVLLPNG